MRGFGAKRTHGALTLTAFGKTARLVYDSSPPTLRYDDLSAASYGGYTTPANMTTFDGDKFFGGFGPTQLLTADYWTLRARSAELFTTNLYARGLIRRLVTNEINTGLTPECVPETAVLGTTDEAMRPWTDDVETRFALWGKTPWVCDYRQQHTFGALQRIARAEALVCGDVLVVHRFSYLHKAVQIQLVSGDAVVTPWDAVELAKLDKTHTITHGVERDAGREIVAYWIRHADGKVERLEARGKESGQRIAYLVFGTDKRLDDERGMPLLAIMLQSLKDIDRYRDSVQRKAVVNSIIAMFIKRTAPIGKSLPVTGGAVRVGSATATDNTGATRTFKTMGMIPGLVIEDLAEGEEPVGFHSQGVDLDFGKFEEAVIQALAWASEIPPEILRLAFSNNYSASQAAINEFKIYLNKIWTDFGEAFCTPIYRDVVLTDVLTRRVKAPGLLDAWRTPSAWPEFAAWMAVEWYGSIKPSTDVLKQAKGSQILVNEGWSTNAREARMNTGSKFDKNIRRLREENVLKAQAAEPLLELQQKYGKPAVDEAVAALTRGDLEDVLQQYLDTD